MLVAARVATEAKAMGVVAKAAAGWVATEVEAERAVHGEEAEQATITMGDLNAEFETALAREGREPRRADDLLQQLAGGGTA